MRASPLILIAALLAVGPAVAARDRASRREARDASDLAKALAGRSAEAAQRCLPASRTDGPMIIGQTLLFRDGRTIWRSDIAHCPALSRDPILVTEVFGGQTCTKDLFRTIERGGGGITGPICQFGPFVPYRKPR